jgi:Domain of unknown function DUF11
VGLCETTEEFTLTHSTPSGTIAQRRPAAQTALALLAILALVFSMMAILAAQPVSAATIPAVLALSEDCNQTALHKQIDWSGNDTDVIGDMHSNAGITVSGARNDVSGSVTFDDTNCNFVLSGSDNTGDILNPSNSGSRADPGYAVPTEEDCDFVFTGSDDVDLLNEDVWLDSNTLEPGLYCHLGTGKLQQSGQGKDGTVSFFAHGHIDLSNGSNANYTPFRADQVLTHSLANSVDAVTLAGSGTDNGNRTHYNGIIYAPNGEAETGGQWINIGCLVAETVKLNGSNHIIGFNCGSETPPPDPTLELTKTNNTTGPVAPGTSVNFTITVEVLDGPAAGSIIKDVLPPGYDAPTAISDNGEYTPGTRTIEWGPLSVAHGDTFTYTAAVSAGVANGTQLVNVAVITSPGTNCPAEAPAGLDTDDPCEDDSIVTVVVPPDPELLLTKTNNTTGPVLPGTSVNFTITVDVTNGPAEGSIIVDTLPEGYDDPTAISDDGEWDEGDRTITWGPLTVADGDTFTYTAAVSATAEDGDELINVAVITSPGTNCPPEEVKQPQGEGEDPCDDDSIVTVDIPPLTPLLLIDKVADATVITISGPAAAQVATPSIVTWTLTYTLTNGPVHNAVITDAVPAGFTFLDAANGGTHAAGTVTWNLGTLTTSGSVSFRTTVNVATISRVAPTVNTAVIDSDETPPDNGVDSVTVTVQPPPLGGNPSPTPAVPNTAMGLEIGGTPVTMPIVLVVALLIGSLGAFAFANVRSRRNREV